MRALPYLLLMFFFLCGDCSSRTDKPAPTPAAHVEPAAALPTSVADIKTELANVRARGRLLEGALEDAKNDAAQTKLWLGAGTCWLAALVLFAIGLWTGRFVLVQIAVAAGGLGALLLVTAWLVPFAYWIGGGALLIMAAIATYMLVNRDKALTQVSAAVDRIKPLVPGYRDVFRAELTGAADTLISHVRRRRAIAPAEPIVPGSAQDPP